MKPGPGTNELPLLELGEKRRRKTKIEDGESSYRSLFEDVNDPVFLLKGGRFVECNASALKLFDCRRDEIIGKYPHEISPALRPEGGRSREMSSRVRSAPWTGAPRYFHGDMPGATARNLLPKCS